MLLTPGKYFWGLPGLSGGAKLISFVFLLSSDPHLHPAEPGPASSAVLSMCPSEQGPDSPSPGGSVVGVLSLTALTLGPRAGSSTW